jgi:alpha-methylacyl-CoA racemase
LSVGALEEPFYQSFMHGLGFTDQEIPDRNDRSRWVEMKAKVAAVLRTRSRDEWLAVFRGTDACVTPVLSLADAPSYEHNAARGTFVDVGGIVEPAPVPHFSRTAAGVPTPAPTPGEHDLPRLTAWGIPGADVEALVAAGVVD